MWTWEEVTGLLKDALGEDEREGGHFDATGFAQYFPEHDKEAVSEAWLLYREHQHMKGVKA